jgi:hypothetical protein
MTMTNSPCIVCVAITGSLPSKADRPAVHIGMRAFQASAVWPGPRFMGRTAGSMGGQPGIGIYRGEAR